MAVYINHYSYVLPIVILTKILFKTVFTMPINLIQRFEWFLLDIKRFTIIIIMFVMLQLFAIYF